MKDKYYLTNMTKAPNYEKLYELALAQQGYFTAHQANECGYSRQLHVYHCSTGEWNRLTRGIFRFKYFPVFSSQPEGFYVTQLWTQNREGRDEGVFGYGSALRIHNLSTYLPRSFHIIVPKHFRRNSKPPGTSRFYRRTLEPDQVERIDGLQVTTQLWTIIDLLESELIDHDYVLTALKEATDRFDIRVSTIKKAKLTADQKELLVKALSDIKYRSLDEIR